MHVHRMHRAYLRPPEADDALCGIFFDKRERTAPGVADFVDPLGVVQLGSLGWKQRMSSPFAFG